MNRFSSSPRLLFLSLLAWAGLASAQTPPSAGSLLRQQELAVPLKPAQLQPAGKAELIRPPLQQAGDTQVLLKSVRFSGVEGLATPAELKNLMQDAIGKPMGYPQLQQLADRVTEFLKIKGWFLARAYLPQQDMTEGELEIAISAARIEGGLQGIELKTPGGRLSHQQIQSVFAATLPEIERQGINSADLERALLVLNELPGITAQAALDRGKTPDTTRLQVTVDEGPLLLSSASLDNFGSRYTGAFRATGSVRVSDPYGAGDQLGLSAVAAQGLTQGSISYSRPVSANGLGLAVSASALNYSIGSDLANLGLAGNAKTLGANLVYPFILGNRLNVRGTLAADYKALTDTGLGATLRDKHLLNWTASVAGNSFDAVAGGGANTFSLALLQGRLDLSNSAVDLADDQAGPRAQGNFGKISYTLARLQKLPGAWSLFANLNGQWANTNLDSSEKFVLGGSSGVRAYPGGEGSGDSGWTAALELRLDMPAPNALGSMQWLAFVDTGRITLNQNMWGAAAVSNADNSNSYGLSGAGVGLTLAKAGRYSVRAIRAQTLGGNPGRSAAGNNSDGLADKNRWLLLSSIYF